MAHVASPAINAGLAANEVYAAAFTAGALPMPPAKKLAIVSCMDARLHPEKVYGDGSRLPSCVWHRNLIIQSWPDAISFSRCTALYSRSSSV
jgi:hypothetical protein